MAASATAPAKPVAKQKTEPREYVFSLTTKYPEYFKGSSPYSRRLVLPMQDDIYWPYKTEGDAPIGIEEKYSPEEVYYAIRRIRYVYGENSIFVDEQEKKPDAYKLDGKGNNRLLDNQLNRDRLTFSHGEIRVDSQDKALKSFLWCMNQCENQNPRAQDRGKKYKQVNVEFKLNDYFQADETKIALGVTRGKAYELAKTVRNNELIPHAEYLKISLTHPDTNQEKDIDAVKEEYIEYAWNNPDKFLKSFGNPKIKRSHQIKELIEAQEITLGGKVPGQAHWISNGTLIAEIPSDRDPIEFLADFSLTKQGEFFSGNLLALKDK